jgi:hypothetical protein
VKGKRTLKKQEKRQASALAELEELYRRRRDDRTDRTDDEILARAAEIPDLAGSPFAGRWAEVAGRALRQSLGGGDLGRLERLLGFVRRGGRPPSVAGLAPLVCLGESILDLAAGRFAAARSRLATLSGGDFPTGLLTALRDLAENEGRRAEDPVLQAARELFGALQSLDLEALAQGFHALRAAASSETAGLLDRAEPCLSLLTGLAALAADLEGGLPQSSPSRTVAAWLQGNRSSLAAALTVPPLLSPPLLAPLRHAVHMRWRAVLQRVARREGSSGLAVLFADAPKLLALDVDLPRGLQGNLAAVRQRTEAQQLLADGRYEKLADLLRSRSRTVAEASTLAALWSLELWTYGRQEIEQAKAGQALLGLFANPFGPPSPPHKALMRLQEMAGEIRQRFPAGRRAEVAGVLRAELFDLCEQIHFCEHTAAAALSLLEFQPDARPDARPETIGLLIAGVAGAVAGDDHQARRALQPRIAQIAQAGKAQARDRAVAHRLMTQVAQEDPWSIATILDALKPLFADDAWTEIAALVAREMVGMLAAGLREESCMAMEDPAAGPLDIDDLRSDLDVLRPALAETPGFIAVEMALDCWLPDRRAAEKRLKKYLAAAPGVEGPLVAFRYLECALGPWAPPGAHAASQGLAAAVIDRLDPGDWQLWSADVPALALATDSSHRQRLEETIRQLLASPEIQEEGSGRLQHALQAVQTIAELQRLASLPPPRRRRRSAGTAKKPRRASQLKLDLP